jgi:predicted alpha/beta superfamily hydrolase
MKDDELIVVAIDQNPEERMNEYCPWEIGEYSTKHFGQVDLPGGKGKDYVDFIINDLKPFIDQKYRTLNDQNSIAGISLGGLISVYAACSYPQVFHKATAISSAFLRNQEELEKYIQHSSLLGVKGIYMDCGDSETNDEMKNKEFVASNKRVYK